MKKLVWLIPGFIVISLACQALVPTVTPQQTLASGGSTAAKPTSETPAPLRIVTPTASSVPFPSVEPINCSDDDCLDACLERIESAVPQTEYQPLTGAYAEHEIDMNLVYYDIKDGQLGDPEFLHVPDTFKAFQQDTAAHRVLWDYASSLLPSSQKKWIDQFVIFSSSSYSGWVAPAGANQDDRSRWTLGMELNYAQNPIDVTYTLVHEYGHLITLNTDQIPASDFYYGWYQNTAVCKQFLSPDGCSTPDSYVNRFYDLFWKDIFEEWQVDVDRPVVNSSEEIRVLVEKFYDKHPELFVRDYAATNLYEDMAESFMLFVLSPRPSGDSIVDQKIRFFYDYPELVSVRQQMIQGICSYTRH